MGLICKSTPTTRRTAAIHKPGSILQWPYDSSGRWPGAHPNENGVFIPIGHDGDIGRQRIQIDKKNGINNWLVVLTILKNDGVRQWMSMGRIIPYTKSY